MEEDKEAQLGALADEIAILSGDLSGLKTKAKLNQKLKDPAKVALQGADIRDDFLQCYEQYKGIAQTAKKLRLIEENFEEKYGALYSNEYKSTRVYAKKEDGEPAPNFPDKLEDNTIYYWYNQNVFSRDRSEKYIAYQVINPQGNKITGFITENEFTAEIKKLGNKNGVPVGDLPKYIKTILEQKGHITPSWKNAPYVSEIKDQLNALDLKHLPTIKTITKQIEATKNSLKDRDARYVLAAVLTGITIIGLLITGIAYALDNKLEKEIKSLKQRESSARGVYSQARSNLLSTQSTETDLKQDIYSQLRNINTFFKPLKERADKMDKNVKGDEAGTEPPKPLGGK